MEYIEQTENESGPHIDEVNVTKHFIQLMYPLVKKGKFALVVKGEPSRKNEEDGLNEIIFLAKKYKLSRNKEESQCSITLAYGEPLEDEKNLFAGSHIKLSINSLTYQERMKRVLIIISIIASMLLMIIM